MITTHKQPTWAEIQELGEELRKTTNKTAPPLDWVLESAGKLVNAILAYQPPSPQQASGNGTDFRDGDLSSMVEEAARELHRIEVELLASDAGELTDAEWQELWYETAEVIKEGWRESARRVLLLGRKEPFTCKDGRERGESVNQLSDRLNGEKALRLLGPAAVEAILTGEAAVVPMDHLNIGRAAVTVAYSDGDEYPMAVVRLDNHNSKAAKENHE